MNGLPSPREGETDLAPSVSNLRRRAWDRTDWNGMIQIVEAKQHLPRPAVWPLDAGWRVSSEQAACSPVDQPIPIGIRAASFPALAILPK